jgi:hypothetical protein
MQFFLFSLPHFFSLVLQVSPQIVDLKLYNDNKPALGHDNTQAEVTVKFELIQEGCRQYVEIAKSEGSLSLAKISLECCKHARAHVQACTCACARACVTLLKLTYDPDTGYGCLRTLFIRLSPGTPI